MNQKKTMPMVTAKSVPMRLVATHPWQSMDPDVYLGSEDYIRRILRRARERDFIELQWMLEQGILTRDKLSEIVTEMQRDILEPAEERAAEIGSTMAQVLFEFDDWLEKQNAPTDKFD